MTRQENKIHLKCAFHCDSSIKKIKDCLMNAWCFVIMQLCLAVFSFDLCTLDAHEKQVLEENTEQTL